MGTATTTKAGQAFDRPSFDALLRRRMFCTESFEIYRTANGFAGDNTGLFDYRPPGCGLQANIVDLWRKHFVLEEDVLELDLPILTPEDVFKTSGHVDKFSDWMCKDPVKGEYFRADHLLEASLEARLQADEKARKMDDIDDLDGSQLADLITRFDIRNPDGNNPVQPPIPFNLMFKSTIGSSAAAPIYLRPETAQGRFMNFRKLLEYNNNVMPFASVSIGKPYRHEISPRSGLLRVREFLMAKVEHFVDPESGMQHPKFDEIRDMELPVLDRETQVSGETTVRSLSVGQAMAERVIDNETLGYFLARISGFLLSSGVDAVKFRFRQHMMNEMAHYACDCWDAELLTSY